jgi:two-component system KDP operon response regulator KdpE
VSDDRPLILVVEDEPQIRRFVCAALEDEGRVVEAGSAAAALEAFTGPAPALAIIDLGLPDRDGVDLIRELRGWTMLPILVLSARSAEAEKVAALDAGADDYLTKPFGVARTAGAGARPAAAAESRRWRDGDRVRQHPRRPRASHGDARRRGDPPDAHRIPPARRAAGQCRPRADAPPVAEGGVGAGHAERGHYLRIYIGHLRQKLEADPARPRHLLTETGVGYRFQLQDSVP